MANYSISRQLVGPTTDYAAFVLPIALWGLAFVLVNPFGDFPLNDDWAYSLTVKHLLETGEFRPSGWTSTTLLGQTMWGALFCLPFGFSFNTVRLATLVAGALGMAGFTLLLQELGCDRRKTIFGTLLLGFNPIYFGLAGTFMTDVDFTALSIASVLFFCRYLRERHTASLLASFGFAFAGLSMRQLGLFLPMAMFATLVLESRRDSRGILLSLAAVLASLALLKGLQAWLYAHNALPALYQAASDGLVANLRSPVKLIASVIRDVTGALLYVGWFLIPVLLWRVPSIAANLASRPRGKHVLVAAAIAGCGLLAALIAAHRLMPIGRNIIHVSGLGPILLHDSELHAALPSLPAAFWIFVTMLSVMGAVLLVLDVALVTLSISAKLRARQASTATSVRAFLILATCIYLAPILLGGYFDRYLLPPTFMMLTLVMFEAHTQGPVPRGFSHERLIRVASIFTLVLTGLFALAGTHDYLSWNRARWALLDTLQKDRVPASRIDGGFEFNGLNSYDPAYVEAPPRSHWWVDDDEYVVQFTPLAGYHVVASMDAGGWLPPLKTKLLVLKRDGG